MVPILFEPFSAFLRQIFLPQKRVQISIYCTDLLLMPRVKLHLDTTANRRISIIEPQNVEVWFRSRSAGAPAAPVLARLVRRVLLSLF
jgi:predicted Rdx family selenoprotein